MAEPMQDEELEESVEVEVEQEIEEVPVEP